MKLDTTNLDLSVLSLSEIKLIEASLNYGDRDSQLSDNYSNLCISEASRILGVTMSRAVTTLSNSKLFSVDDKDEVVRGRCQSYPRDAVVWLSRDAVNAYFDLVDAQKAALVLDIPAPAVEVPPVVEPAPAPATDLLTTVLNAMPTIAEKVRFVEMLRAHRTTMLNTPMIKAESDAVFGMLNAFGTEWIVD